jgi:predicted ribosomally synthesized peptide with nif11-like leader
MSSSNIEKFYALAYAEPELASTIENMFGSENIVEDIVALGEAHGCSFTTQETTEFLAAMSARNDKGELDDLQLEAVAGGKHKPALLSSLETSVIQDVNKAVAGTLVPAVVAVLSAVPGGKV